VCEKISKKENGRTTAERKRWTEETSDVQAQIDALKDVEDERLEEERYRLRQAMIDES
jgi:hypothetical protein